MSCAPAFGEWVPCHEAGEEEEVGLCGVCWVEVISVTSVVSDSV